MLLWVPGAYCRIFEHGLCNEVVQFDLTKTWVIMTLHNCVRHLRLFVIQFILLDFFCTFRLQGL